VNRAEHENIWLLWRAPLRENNRDREDNKRARKKGYRVATVKHTHLDIKLDRENEDTKKHREAGAFVSTLCAKNETSIIFSDPLKLEEILKVLEPLCDIVLVEGFKDAKIKKFSFGNVEFTEGTLFKYDKKRFKEVLEIIEKDPENNKEKRKRKEGKR
jgi:Molybdopterin-guanine dinucleotide biosynthesis protein